MLDKIFSNKSVNSFSLKLFVKLYRFCYRAIGKLAILDNDGIHPKHRLMQYHKFFTSHVSSEETVIDIGCGKGETAYDVAQTAKQVVAVDMKEKNIAYAKEHFQRDNLEFIVANVLTYDFGKRFDKIVFSNVLEHIEDRVAFLKKLHDISDVILLRVPMLDRDWLAVYEKEKGLDYRLDPTHYIEYTLPILQKELEQSGWQISSHSIQFGEFWGVVKNL